MKTSRHSSPNSRRTSFGRPSHAGVSSSNDSCQTMKQHSRDGKSMEGENPGSTFSCAGVKSSNKLSKPTSRLSFFKSRIKKSEEGAKNNDLLQAASNNSKKQEQQKGSSRDAIAPCIEERSSSASRLSGIIKPRKFGETFKVIKSVKDDVVRPSSDSSHQSKSRKSVSSDNTVSGCPSLSHNTFAKKLSFGMPFCKSKSNHMSEKKVDGELGHSVNRQEQSIYASVDCVPRRSERNSTFIKEDFEATGLPTSFSNIPETLSKEPGLSRAYSEDYCEKSYLGSSPSLSSRASSFGILNESYLLEQTFGGDVPETEVDLLVAAEGLSKRQRNNTFVIKSHGRDKVLSLSSLMSNFSRKTSSHDSKQKALSCTFVVGDANSNSNNSNINNHKEPDCLEKLGAVISINSKVDCTYASATSTKEVPTRPPSMFSACSADAGIVADDLVDEGDRRLPNKAGGMRPVSIISTSSIDTGYQPDSDVENCRISNLSSLSSSSSCNTSSNTVLFNNTLVGSLIASPSSFPSKSACSPPQSPSSPNSSSHSVGSSQMTDRNNNSNDNNDVDNVTYMVSTATTWPSDATPVVARLPGDLPTIDPDEESSSHERTQGRAVFPPETSSVEGNHHSLNKNLRIFGGGTDDDDDDEDDYLVLSNGSSLFSGRADIGGSIHVTSTPDKKGHQGRIVAPSDIGNLSVGLEEDPATGIELISCSSDLEKLNNVEGVNFDLPPVENFPNPSGLYVAHSMELSCIIEADNETLPLGECTTSEVGTTEEKEEVDAIAMKTQEPKSCWNVTLPLTLTPVMEEVDGPKLNSATPEEQVEAGVLSPASTSPDPERGKLNTDAARIGHMPSVEAAATMADETRAAKASLRREVEEFGTLGSPVDPASKDNNKLKVEVKAEVSKGGTDNDPSKEAADQVMEVSDVVEQDINSRVEKQLGATPGVVEDKTPGAKEDTSEEAMEKGALLPGDKLVEVMPVDDVTSAGGYPKSSTSVSEGHAGGAEQQATMESPGEVSKEDILPGCRSSTKSSPESKTSPRNSNNVGKSTPVKKSVGAAHNTKSISGKTILKPDKSQKLPGSTSITPRNTPRTPQSSSSIQSKSKLSESVTWRSSVTSKNSTPKLQKSLASSNAKAPSVNVSLNHLVDSQRTNQNLDGSTSSSPKMNDKSLSPAGSDGKLENAAFQGKKVPPKNLFQSSTDLKSKGPGEVGIPVKSLFKKPLPVKRFSVTQESLKLPGGVPRRASVNVPATSSTRDKYKTGLVSTNSSNMANVGQTASSFGVKKPAVPPKPSQPRNNLTVKQVSSSSNKSSLNNSFNKSANSISQLCYYDNRSEDALAQKDIQLHRMRVQLLRTLRSFEALSVVIKYFESKVDKKQNALMSATKKLHQASSTLASLKEQLSMVTRQRDSLLAEVQKCEERHKRETKDLMDSMNAERVMMEKEVANKLEAEANRVTKQHAESISSLKSTHVNELDLLIENHRKAMKMKEDERMEEMRSINEQHEKKMRNISSDHKRQLDELTFRFEQMKMTLLEKVEVLRSECDDLRCRESTFMESCQREAESQVQSCLSRYKQLPQEIESLKAVLELRNQEVHELRTSNLERQKEHEELEESRRTIHFLKQKIENLEAIVDMRGDYERQLTEKHQLLLRKLERESKVNKRLSMNNEELQWKLSSAVQLPNLGQPLTAQQMFPSAMSSSFTSGVTSAERKFGKGALGDKRPLSVSDATQVSQQRTPSPTAQVCSMNSMAESQQGEVFSGSYEPVTPSFLSFSPPRHHNTRAARVSAKSSKNVATTTAGSASGHSRTLPASAKGGSASGVCASGDGNKLQRSGTYSLKDLGKDSV